jgi:hypothetical protein
MTRGSKRNITEWHGNLSVGAWMDGRTKASKDNEPKLSLAVKNKWSAGWMKA